MNKIKFKTSDYKKIKNKVIECDIDGVHYRVTATQNLLVPVRKRVYDINHFGDYFIVIGQAHSKEKILRVESKIFAFEQFDDVIEDQINLVLNTLKEKFDTCASSITQVPAKIKLK